MGNLKFVTPAGPGNADLFHYASECRKPQVPGEPIPAAGI
jgi:hypothetical protein